MLSKIMNSEICLNGVHSTSEILLWIKRRNEEINVDIGKTTFDNCGDWFYDDEQGEIRNKNRSFFTITGIKCKSDNKFEEQPIIIQDEIGYLGFLVKEINGILHFLIQAKIEPGNINNVQLSPTIQATKSNFTKQHGGASPKFLEYFLNAKNENILVDQIQSEQSSRFYKKRNRNVIVFTDDDIEESDNFRWVTLGQLYDLLTYDNLINMDTRTVLSCIPFVFNNKKPMDFRDDIVKIYNYINNIKMFDKVERNICDIKKLQSWNFNSKEIVSDLNKNFRVVFCDINIEGREVRHWYQPLFEATNRAIFGLFYVKDENGVKVLVNAKKEIGCFDVVEIAPTIQKENIICENKIDELFFENLKNKDNVLIDVMLSEEGGRFYHEENRNVIIRLKEKIETVEGYFWLDLNSLNLLCQVNNTLNIQLRNLLTLLRAKI